MITLPPSAKDHISMIKSARLCTSNNRAVADALELCAAFGRVSAYDVSVALAISSVLKRAMTQGDTITISNGEMVSENKKGERTRIVVPGLIVT